MAGATVHPQCACAAAGPAANLPRVAASPALRGKSHRYMVQLMHERGRNVSGVYVKLRVLRSGGNFLFLGYDLASCEPVCCAAGALLVV